MQYFLTLLLLAISKVEAGDWSPVVAKDPVHFDSIKDRDINLLGVAGATDNAIYI